MDTKVNVENQVQILSSRFYFIIICNKILVEINFKSCWSEPEVGDKWA